MVEKKMMRYSTTDRVEYVYNKLSHLGLTKSVIKQVLNADAQCISEILIGGNDVNIYGVGTFKIAYKAPTDERIGVNPATLEQITIAAVPEHNKITFKPTSSLKEAVKEASLGNAIKPIRGKVKVDDDAEEADAF